MAKKKKVRVELRRNRPKPPRQNDLTRQFQEDEAASADAHTGERVRAKGEASRYRTVVQDESAADATMPAVDATTCLPGRVLRARLGGHVGRLQDR